MSRSEYSEEISSQIDAQVRAIIDHCYTEALRLIRENRHLVDCLVDILLDKETIEGEEFRRIVTEYTQRVEKHLAV